jgi:3-hydroxybutyryl-CoA dehydratase
MEQRKGHCVMTSWQIRDTVGELRAYLFHTNMGAMQNAAFASLMGLSTSFRKTVSESDVYLFAGITGDLSPNHVDEAAMRATQYGGRIAHGALLVGYMSGASTDIVAKSAAVNDAYLAVSLGYDRIRFLEAVKIGDTITMNYVVTAIDDKKLRSIADVTIHNQNGVLCAVATHIMRWLPR